MQTETKFVNMRRWSAVKLDKELYFADPNSPVELERAWAAAVQNEVRRRATTVSA